MKATWRNFSKVMFLGGALALAGGVQAATGDGAVGVQLGWSIPKDIDGRFGFGLDAGYEVIDNVQVGAYLQYNTGTEGTGAAEVAYVYMPFGLKVNYLFTDFVEGLYAGANLGMVRISSNPEATGVATKTNSDLSLGIQLGYDFKVAAEFSVGGTYEYIWINSDPDSGYVQNIFATAKYHF